MLPTESWMILDSFIHFFSYSINSSVLDAEWDLYLIYIYKKFIITIDLMKSN